jgi:hypothetical protein
MSFFILNSGKKSTKFWQLIVNYGRFVCFKEQLGFFEFCYELANHAQKKHAPIFLRKYAFFGQNTKFSSSMWEIFPRSIFFLSSKVSSEFRKRSFFKPPYCPVQKNSYEKFHVKIFIWKMENEKGKNFNGK